MNNRTRFLAWLGSLILSLLQRCWRTEIIGLERLEQVLARNQKAVVVFWHGGYLPLFTLLQGRGGCVFVSRSRRGEVICGICRRFGYECVQVPEHAGAQALELMCSKMSHHSLAGLAVDGPRGPYHLVKPGAIRLASSLGASLLPVAAASRRSWVLRRRWDRMAIPLPFSRICLVVGPPLTVEPALGGEPVAAWTGRLHEALEEAGRRAKQGLEGQR